MRGLRAFRALCDFLEREVLCPVSKVFAHRPRVGRKPEQRTGVPQPLLPPQGGLPSTPGLPGTLTRSNPQPRPACPLSGLCSHSLASLLLHVGKTLCPQPSRVATKGWAPGEVSSSGRERAGWEEGGAGPAGSPPLLLAGTVPTGACS